MDDNTKIESEYGLNPNRFRMLAKAKAVIDSCKSIPQLEAAIMYKDVTLRELYPHDVQRRFYEHWDGYLCDKLNEKALDICGLLEDDDDER